MAADILAYHATHVPVGEDQKQHLELARDIAQKFNNDYADAIRAAGIADGIFFPQPEPVIQGPATRVMSLRDGTKKMSKSDASDLSRINMTDDADTIARKIQKAKTDPEPLPSEEAGLDAAPGGRQPRRHLRGAGRRRPRRPCCSRVRRRPVLDLQEGAGRARRSPKISPITAEMRRLTADPAEIDRILADGSRRARAIAAPIMDKVKDIVGFIRS